MKQIITTTALAAICIFVSGCASIVNGGARTVRINSDPPGAKITVFDKSGQTITNLITPASLRLKRHNGYFSGQKYKVVFENPGYYSSEIYIQTRVNGWYFGNIVFGGLIGFLIVDPVTGAMWTFAPKEVDWKLISSSVTLTPEQLKEAELKANPPKQKPKPAPTGKGSAQ